ncbi:hypothetical protein [Streptomyces sp. NPDC050485]|uniref:hypothetical protein n=1 Tax=Streptomyces sp. NPDC050485 TaxID=3365617 RepID=UPI0037AE2DED
MCAPAAHENVDLAPCGPSPAAPYLVRLFTCPGGGRGDRLTQAIRGNDGRAQLPAGRPHSQPHDDLDQLAHDLYEDRPAQRRASSTLDHLHHQALRAAADSDAQALIASSVMPSPWLGPCAAR